VDLAYAKQHEGKIRLNLKEQGYQLGRCPEGAKTRRHKSIPSRPDWRVSQSLIRQCLNLAWRSRSLRKEEEPPRVPDGVRIYAIGDVHGRADLLAQVLADIDGDLAMRPSPRAIHVFLGDYVDRGPDSREVLDQLVERAQTHELICLKGNHESYLVDFLSDSAIFDAWRQFGGAETLLSYGLTPSLKPDAAEQLKLAADLASAIPCAHHKFLQELRLSYTCGDFFFAHAGVRPGIPLAQQREEDLLWIREDFLSSNKKFGKVVVHGHTPVMEPDVRPNRINIDTGAFATGRLTCLVLQGEELILI
jgi:serine/threonine protein phosphatase 1